MLTVDDALGSAQRVVLKPDRLCSATDVGAPGTGMRHPRAHLMCYALLNHGDRTALLDVHTANQLGAGEVLAFGAEELCVPARAEEPESPCLTGGDECGLPCCRVYPVQHADCTFSPTVASPRYRGCSGPLVLVDGSHANFHEVTPESTRYPGRYWGFAKLLVRDGYVVRDSVVPLTELLPATSAKIVVMANPRAIQGPEAVSAADIAALLTWVENGGSLLLSIDHSPYDRVDALLTALGLVHSGSNAPQQTFTRSAGLNPASVIANGSGPGEAIDEVTTFVGTAFGIAPTPPSQAQYDPVLTFPPGSKKSLEGLLQGVTIAFGAGRVYVSGESGGLTAQDSFGMQFTPDNAQYVLNIVHWLDD